VADTEEGVEVRKEGITVEGVVIEVVVVEEEEGVVEGGGVHDMCVKNSSTQRPKLAQRVPGRQKQ